jgi:superfamily I DNA and/or RNA helicase
MVASRCPVLRLDTQYRMNKEIADCPGRYFYGGLLNCGEQARDSLLAPYTVMNVHEVARTEGGICWNKDEVGVVIRIIEAVREMLVHKPSIGVITFYAKQRQNISLEVQNKKLNNIVVNTVDGFQGSERNIIISCVRGGLGGNGFLQDR